MTSKTLLPLFSPSRLLLPFVHFLALTYPFILISISLHLLHSSWFSALLFLHSLDFLLVPLEGDDSVTLLASLLGCLCKSATL